MFISSQIITSSGQHTVREMRTKFFHPRLKIHVFRGMADVPRMLSVLKKAEKKCLQDKCFQLCKGCHVEEGFDLCCPQRIEIGLMSKRSTEFIFYVYILWKCGTQE